MQTLKSVFSLIGALAPVLYCGGLIYYFLDISGSVQEAKMNGLGPILLGLGTVGLLFCIPVVLKIVRIFSGPRSPRSGGSGGPNRSARDDDDGFDADAAIARYMAERSAEILPNSPALSSRREGDGPARRPGFGRKTK